MRIEELFSAPHQVREFVAHSRRTKGANVDSCSMLRLQRAIIFIDHQRNQITHETVVSKRKNSIKPMNIIKD